MPFVLSAVCVGGPDGATATAAPTRTPVRRRPTETRRPKGTTLTTPVRGRIEVVCVAPVMAVRVVCGVFQVSLL